MKIASNLELINQVKDFARSASTSVGGYPKVLIMRDGGCLCSACAKSEFKRLLEELRDECDPAFMPLGVDVLWEGAPLNCNNCDSQIESAYGDPEE